MKKTHHHTSEDTAASATESRSEQKTAGLSEVKTGQDAADSPRIEASTAKAGRDAASVEAATVSKTVKSDETALTTDPADGPDADEDVAAHADDAEPKKTYAEGKGTDPEASENTEAADTDGASVTDTADAGAEPETAQTVEPKEAPEPTKGGPAPKAAAPESDKQDTPLTAAPAAANGKAACALPAGFEAAKQAVALKDVMADAPADKVVLLNLWALWCAPCRTELPLLDKLAASQKAMKVQTLNLGDKEPDIATLFAKMGLKNLSQTRT